MPSVVRKKTRLAHDIIKSSMDVRQKAHRTQQIISWIIILGVFGLALAAVWHTVGWELRPRQMVSIGSSVYRVDVADTPEAQERGLGGRASLGSDEAMLFMFDRDDVWPIWMKGMKFPIDIVWLDKDKKVVHVEHNVQLDAEPYVKYAPPKPARYVLELNAGQAKEASISVGRIAKFDIAKEGL